MKTLHLLLILFIGTFATSISAQNSKAKKSDEIKSVKIKIKIKISEIPNTVTKTLNKEFNHFVAEKAYKTKKNNKQAYLISLIKNDITEIVYIDPNGKVLNKYKNN